MANNNEISISVIIPARNAELFLPEALASVMRQEYVPLEVIIVDDGSTDATADIARSFGHNVRCVPSPQRGAAHARNEGIRLARGNVIAFLDADDIWPDDKLKNQIAIFKARPGLGAVFGMVQHMVAVEGNGANRVFENIGLPSAGVNLGSAIFKRSVFDAIGLFDQAMALSEDVDFFMRMREGNIPFFISDGVALFYRLHEANLTRDKRTREAAFLQALKMSIERRKSRGSGIAPLERE